MMSIHTHAVRVQYKKIKESPVGPRSMPASIMPSMRQDSLFVVASVCCQLARPVSACRLTRPPETKGGICDTLFRGILQGYCCGRGTSGGGGDRHGEHFTEV